MVVISESFRKVVVLTDVVAKICAGLNIGALVDLGSGKGYLSQVCLYSLKLSSFYRDYLIPN